MRPLSALVATLVLTALGAGCFGGTPPGAEPPGGDAPPPGATGYPIGCRIRDEERQPLAGAVCHFVFDVFTHTAVVDSEGYAEADVPANATGKVRGTAEGRTSKAASIRADAPKIVEMVLEKVPEGETPSPTTAPTEPSVPTTRPPPTPEPPVAGRAWTEPITVTSSGNEPHLTVDSKGVIYYAPTSALYKSTNGGKSFNFVPMSAALPTLGSDTSVTVAPDDSVWFSRYWGYAGGTLACTSTNKGESWTCDNAAIPGATDRMWSVGVSGTEGYVQTNEGLYHHIWAKTTTGSTKYLPHATTPQLLAVRNGNMVYDEKNKAVFQIEFVGGTQRLYRVDGLGGVLTSTDTGVPATYALPWLSVHDGVLWTTGEPGQKVVAARSTDGGKTWKRFPVSQDPKSATFSYIAAGPEGRVALVYYGSDKGGHSTTNGGVWSLYIAETDNGLDANPTWVETKLVPNIHKGNICIGLSCEQSGGDVYARFSGDLIGIAMDPEGNAHVAYNKDWGDHDTLNEYVRQLGD